MQGGEQDGRVQFGGVLGPKPYILHGHQGPVDPVRGRRDGGGVHTEVLPEAPGRLEVLAEGRGERPGAARLQKQHNEHRQEEKR